MSSPCGQWLRCGWCGWGVVLLLLGVCGAIIPPGRAGIADIERISLPPLRLRDAPLTAHTQGLEIVGDSIYVTARQDAPAPRRALLLRTARNGTAWDLWELGGSEPGMDHPGGFQSDGQRLWIPLAMSQNGGSSLIRAYAIADLKSGHLPAPEVEFVVADHIGALAVLPQEDLLVGAAWDTDVVYLWDLRGRLKQTLRGTDLRRRGLGAKPLPGELPGLAVQDWKFVDGVLVAGGLVKHGGSAGDVASRLVWLDRRLEHLPTLPPLPLAPDNVELCREGMAVAGDSVWFLPGDLGATNAMYRISWPALRNQACDCN